MILVDKYIEKAEDEIWYRIWGDREFIYITRCCLATEKRDMPYNWITSG